MLLAVSALRLSIAIAGREFGARAGRALPEYEIGGGVAAAGDRVAVNGVLYSSDAVVAAVRDIEISETVDGDLRRLA